MSSRPRILIIGGGLGGLTLAQGLKRAGVHVQIFERDDTRDFRAQGYRIRLNPQGAEALRQALPVDVWELFEKTCAKMVDGMARVNGVDLDAAQAAIDPARAHMMAKAQINSKLGPYSVDRTVFRSTLLHGLEEHISFGKVFDRYEIIPGGVRAVFRDGTVEEGDLIVGADGVRSAVRKQYLPQYQIYDTDGAAIYGKTPLTPELVERALPLSTGKMTMIRDSTPLSLLFEPMRFERTVDKAELLLPPDYMYWVLASRKAPYGIEDDQKLLSLSGAEVAQLSLNVTSHWHPAARAILELQDHAQASTIRIFSCRPEIPPWESNGRITVLGDAAHPMSPSAGTGAAIALRDAAELCRIIVEDGISTTSITKYEAKMREYVRPAVEGSFQGGKSIFNCPSPEQCKPVCI
ncbi:cercosporin toxin biosynthesis protein [Xylona heveae TC161]|uniref:Cercosporin toxin biosynthesis protein n=1 Tax=Xylona heveae (strain CBS 132557 / TC161) TaxID=1328760 RepID=A0A165ILD0_XYLHT|nr:cercosporin toxin biosynthesis protein [Xylona heveae TC161]KZF25062.1 cercosporin toxin biosynthesis protein [Xylona heveae TC161]